MHETIRPTRVPKILLIKIWILTFLLLGTSWAAAQDLATALKSNIGIGIRSGPSFFTQDLSGDLDAETDPILISGEILYVQSDVFSFGFNIEWQTHDVDSASLGPNLGKFKTLSLIPFAEIRPLGIRRLSPYGLLGLSYNFNSFSFKSQASASCSPPCRLIYEPDNTIGTKIGAGLDIFASRSVSLNVELGWEVNSGDVDSGLAGTGSTPIVTEDFDANVLTLLLGFRFYFF